jgi:hypothetical protein
LELRNVRIRGLTFLGPRTHKKKRERRANSADSTREEKACSPGISSAISQKEEPCISTPQDTETLDLRERDNGVESEKRTPFYFFRSQKLCMKNHGEKKTKHKGVQKPKIFVKKKKTPQMRTDGGATTGSKQSVDSDISLPPPGDDDCAKKRKNATTSRETKTSSGCAHARRRNPSASADGKATPPSPQQHLEACKPTVLDELPLPGDESKTHDREAKLAETLTRTTSSISSLLLDRNCVVFVGTASPGAKLLCLHGRDPKTHLSRKP